METGEETNTITSSSSSVPIKRKDRLVVPKDRTAVSFDEEPMEPIDEPYMPRTWYEFFDENGKYIFAAIACIVFVPMLLLPTLIFTGLVKDGNEE